MKKNNFALAFVIVTVFVVIVSAVSFAEARGKTSIFRFLKEARSPRQLSLGSVNTFFAPDAFASFHNPAAMTLALSEEISFAGGSRISGISGATGGISKIFRPRKGDDANAVGFNFTYDGSNQLKTVAPSSGDRYDFTDSGSFATYSLTAGGYYSAVLSRSHYGFSSGFGGGQTYFGLGGKLIVDKLYERSYTGVAFDIALLEESDASTAFSIGVKNLGANFGSSDSYPLPTSAFLSILKKVGIISFAIDVEYDAQGFGDVKGGLELNLIKGFAFRAGFKHPFSEYDSGNFLLSRASAGFGIALGRGKFIFDYAWRPMGDLGMSHIAALRTKL